MSEARHGRTLPGGEWLASQVAELVGGVLHGPDLPLLGVAELTAAGPTDLAYVERREPPGCAAGAVLIRAPRERGTSVVVEDPKAAMLDVLDAAFSEELFAADRGGSLPDPWVHPDATVHPTAQLDPGVRVHAGARVGPHCHVGQGTVLFANVVLYPRTLVGRYCRVHAGAVLGADGFSYHPTASGPRKVPQVGRVRVEDHVEIGANTCIDRAFLGETVVGEASKLDNLVQLGHNSRLGRAVVVAAQSGLSGSVTVGDGVLMGGQVGVADHAKIGAGARLAARSGVHGRVKAGEAVFGAPAMPLRQARRVVALIPRLPELWRRLRALEARVSSADEEPQAEDAR